jgi:PAS domain S-box-containing protein
MKQSWPSGDTEMARRIREYVWAGTSLGPTEHWSPRLRTHVETMLASAQAVAIVCAPDRITLYNDACAAIFGSDHPDALGRPYLETFAETAAVLTQGVDRAFSGETVEIKAQHFDPDGARTAPTSVFDIYLTPIRKDDGSIAYVHAVCSSQEFRFAADAALKESEQRQAFLLELSDTLRPLADPHEIQKASMRVLGQHLKASRVAYTQLTDKEYIIEGDYVDGVPSMAGRYRIDEFGPNKVAAYQEGVTRLVPDAQSDAFNDPAAVANFAAVGVRAGIGVPLFKNGRMVATLVVHQREPRNWTRQEVALAEDTAERTWAALERARAEAALRESEQKYRSLFENLGQGYSECELIRDADGHVTDFRYIALNPAFERLTGLKIAGMIGRTAREAVPDIADSHFEKYERIVAAGAPSREEYRIDALDRWYENHVYPSKNDRFFSLYEDITERKRAEAALRESEARLTAAFESVPVGLAVIDPSGEVVIANPEYLRFLPARLIPSRDSERVGRWQAWDSEGRPLEPHHFPSARALLGETVVPGQEMLHTNDEGREIWTSVATAPTRDEQGRVTGAVSVISDIDVAKRSVAALRDSEERLRQFGDASQDILWIRDATTLQWQYLTPAFETIYGLRRDEALSGDDYRNWQDLIVPEDRDHAVASIERVLDGERVTFEYRIRRPVDGQIRWLRNTDFPIKNKDGRVTLIGGIGHDFTDAKEKELRFRTLVEGVPQLVWRSGDEGAWTWSSPQWTAFTGLSEEASRGLGWIEALHPEDRGSATRAWQVAEQAGAFELEYRIFHADEDRYRWFSTRGSPLKDEDGRIIEWLGTSTDIDDLRRLQDQQQVMVAELQHRTRNLIAVVRSIAQQTMTETGPTPAFNERFSGRMAALARVQGLLSRSEEEPITIGTLIGMELDALGAPRTDKRVAIGGPAVPIRLSVVQTLALALHELGTNARKYGALASDQGQLDVRWHVHDEDRGSRRLMLEWLETFPPMEITTSRTHGGGYGRQLIQEALPYTLGAKTSFELNQTSLRCTIDMPLERRKRGRDR